MAPLMRSDYADEQAPCGMLSFLDMIDALVVGKLRAAGVPLQYLRKAHSMLADEFSSSHPFSRRDILTDGKKVFLHVASELGEEHLKELLSHQHVFPEILVPVLKKISYDRHSLLAQRWDIFGGVTVDPARRYGKPIVESVGIPTAILAMAYQANGSNGEVVADWYGITKKQVMLAVHFEKKMAGAAA